MHFREDDPRVESPTPPTPITSKDMDVIIRGWEIKFEQISRCLRDVQLASEKANSDMFSITRDGRARENQQERRIEAMHVGITEFLKKCDPPHLLALRHLDAPTASTPYSTSISNHLLSARTSHLNPRAARIRASEISTTIGTRAHGITMTLGTRAPGKTTTLGTPAPGIMTTLGKRATGITTTLGTRAPGITTTSRTRASESTTTLGTRASETFTTIEIGAGITDPTNGLHMRTIEEIAATCSEIHTIVG